MKQSNFENKNGLKITHYHLPSVNSTTACLMFKVGSADEKEDEFGASHFLEHMFFEGSKNYPNPDENHVYLEKLGIVDNAWTYKNITNYWMKMPNKSIEQGLELLFDRLNNSIFSDEAIEKEKGIILEEIKMGKDEPWKNCFNNFCKIAFSGKGLAHPTVGYEKTVSSFTPSLIKNYFNSHYTKKNLNIWIGSNNPYQELEPILDNFTIAENTPKSIDTSYPKTEKSLHTMGMDINSYYIDLGFNGIHVKRSDLIPILLASIILGEGEASLLNQRLKIEKGLVSEIGLEPSVFKEDGFFMMYFSTHMHAKEAIDLTIDTIRNLARKPIKKSLLTRAINTAKANLVANQENSQGFGTSETLYNLVRLQLLSGSEILFDDIYNQIDSTTPDEVSEALNNLISKQKFYISIVGPKDIDETKFNSLKDITP